LDVLGICQQAGVPIGHLIADRARQTAEQVLGDAPVAVDIVVIDRAGVVVGRA
jgi:cobalt-precorrin-5B (C1)-methyltransferase